MMTSKGYEYMLKDYAHQVWDFLLFIVEHTESFLVMTNQSQSQKQSQKQSQSQSQNNPKNVREEILLLIFMLSYTEVGSPYPIEALTEVQRQVIYYFSDVGIVYMRSRGSKLFYPSQTAVNMLFGTSSLPSGGTLTSVRAGTSSGAPGGAAAGQGGGGGEIVSVKDYNLQIIVETNLQVTAYLTTDLHLALLQLFVKVTVRLPNMAFGRLVREKVKDAYRAGIQASQIIDFLQFHAHPIVKNNATILPSNVIDQLVLWEMEMQRVSFAAGSYLEVTSLINHNVFKSLVNDLKHKKMLLWSSDLNKLESKLAIVVTPDGENEVKRFLAKVLNR
jgi:transcription initiation factor TFIIH subunit 4